MIKEPKTLCVDFDQTICDSVYPEVGPVKAGAKEALMVFKALGWKIIISSCRSCGWNWDLYYPNVPFTHCEERPVHQKMVQWLADNEIPYDEIDDGTKGKVSAALYIDDKGFRFENNWPDVVHFVLTKLEGK